MSCMWSYIEEQFKSEKIQSIIDFWTERTENEKSIDLDTARKAASLIYARHGLKAPDVCYWESPISMLLAAETRLRGYKWVKQRYGIEIIHISNEYQKWLFENDNHRMLKPNSKKNLLSGFNELRHKWYPTLNLETIKWVHGGLSTYYSRFLNSSTDSVEFHALHGALEPNEELYSANILSNKTPLSKVFTAPDAGIYFAQQDIVAHVLNLKIPDSYETGFRLLAQCCYKAILTETDLWVCAAPKMIIRNLEDEVDCSRRAAVRFIDDSELYVVNGFPVPESYITEPEEMTLESMPYNCSMREAFLRCYGIKRFLIDSKAKCVDKDLGRRLWKLKPDACNTVRSILEIDGNVHESIDGPDIHYYESFKQASTFAEFEESLDEHASFTITNQLT